VGLKPVAHFSEILFQAEQIDVLDLAAPVILGNAKGWQEKSCDSGPTALLELQIEIGK
jgi:hypothetical protein